jgi:hypothetical protein
MDAGSCSASREDVETGKGAAEGYNGASIVTRTSARCNCGKSKHGAAENDKHLRRQLP